MLTIPAGVRLARESFLNWRRHDASSEPNQRNPEGYPLGPSTLPWRIKCETSRYSGASTAGERFRPRRAMRELRLSRGPESRCLAWRDPGQPPDRSRRHQPSCKPGRPSIRRRSRRALAPLETRSHCPRLAPACEGEVPRMQARRSSSTRTDGLKSACWKKAARVGTRPALGKACFMAMARGFSAKALPVLPGANRH